MKNLRAGVSRVREELEALAREPVAELTADVDLGAGGTGTRIVVGTEAALHQLDAADVVAFLDLDQELLAPRYRAAEEAFGPAGPGRPPGRRARRRRSAAAPDPPAPATRSCRRRCIADPARVAAAEADRRRELAYPPATAMAVVSGPSAPAWVEAFGSPPASRCSARPTVGGCCGPPTTTPSAPPWPRSTRPPGRLRLEVDPLRL